MDQSQCNTFGEKEYATDLLAGEKYLAAQYNAFLAECATPEMVQCLSELLSDTHSMQQGLFQEMNSRGWYPVSKAEDQKLQQAKQKFACTVTK